MFFSGVMLHNKLTLVLVSVDLLAPDCFIYSAIEYFTNCYQNFYICVLYFSAFEV